MAGVRETLKIHSSPTCKQGNSLRLPFMVSAGICVASATRVVSKRLGGFAPMSPSGRAQHLGSDIALHAQRTPESTRTSLGHVRASML